MSPQRFGNRAERDRGEEERSADEGDGGDEDAAHGAAASGDLSAEVEREARAHEEECCASGRSARRVDARMRRDVRADVRKLEAGDDEEHDHLRDAEDAERGEHGPDGEEDERDDRDGDEKLERSAVRVHAGEHGREQVVHDESDRVREIEEVREGPDPRVHDRGGTAGGGLDERAQPAG